MLLPKFSSNISSLIFKIIYYKLNSITNNLPYIKLYYEIPRNLKFNSTKNYILTKL